MNERSREFKELAESDFAELIRKQRDIIAQLEEALNQKSKELEAIETSRSFQLTKPLRDFRRFLDKSYLLMQFWGKIRLRDLKNLFHRWHLRCIQVGREIRINGWNGLKVAAKRRLRKRPAWESTKFEKGKDYTAGLVSIAILTKNRLDLIKPCIESIEQNVSQKYQVEILIGDTGSSETEVWAFYDEMQQKFNNIRIVKFNHYFFSNNCNILINKYAKGEFIILLNNDTITTSGWIDNLIAPLENKNIGIVGCKLLYEDNTIQHAGIEFNKDGNGIHAYHKQPRNCHGANYNALVPAVTFACIAMRHDIYGRFQLCEDFIEECQDTDFCLRLREAGFEVLYTPEAEVYHWECSTRDWRKGEGDRRILRKRWGKKINEFMTQSQQRSKYIEDEYRNSITIIRDDGIGDLLMGVSAFKTLKERNPDKKLILATYQRNIEMMAGFKIFDEFIPIPDGDKYAPIPISSQSNTYNFINYEHEAGKSREENKIHRHLMYMQILGLNNGFYLEQMPDYLKARERVLELFKRLKINLNQNFVVLNLLATNPARSWWQPYYPKLIAAIEEMGFIPVVVGKENCRYFKGRRLVNLVGKTKTITEYIEVLKLGKYVISTDTSAYHIAALSGIPFLAIFSGGVKPEARLSFYTKYEAVEPPIELECHPCWDEGCARVRKDLSVHWKKDPCRILITPEMVISKFERLVERYSQGEE